MSKDYSNKHKAVHANRENLPDDYVSKTELKNIAKDLQGFAKELIELSADKVSLLPLNETTKSAISDYYKQSGNIAIKRHLAFIAKCLRHDEVDESKQIIADDSFSSLRAQAAIRADKLAQEKKNQVREARSKVDKLVELLITDGDKQIQKMVENNASLNRQTLRQLVRNLQNSKIDKKRIQAKVKLSEFIVDNQLDA